MGKGRAGERYLLGGENWTFAEFFDALGDVSGVAPPRLRLPSRLYRIGGLASEELARRLGNKPAVDRISREMGGLLLVLSVDEGRTGARPRPEGRAGDAARYGALAPRSAARGRNPVVRPRRRSAP